MECSFSAYVESCQNSELPLGPLPSSSHRSGGGILIFYMMIEYLDFYMYGSAATHDHSKRNKFITAEKQTVVFLFHFSNDGSNIRHERVHACETADGKENKIMAERFSDSCSYRNNQQTPLKLLFALYYPNQADSNSASSVAFSGACSLRWLALPAAPTPFLVFFSSSSLPLA